MEVEQTSTSNNEKSKTKIKRESTPRVEKIVIDVPKHFDPVFFEPVYKAEPDKPISLYYEVRKVRMDKTAYEKQQSRRIYRKKYMTKPNVQEKIKARLAKPEVQAKRKAYAEREDVKARKKELSERNRAIRKALKEQKPE